MDTFIKRIITISLSLFLISYVIYQCVQVFYNPVKTETVYSSSEYKIIDAEGFTVRNESVITGKKKGYLFYTVENGNRVSKGGEVARVYPTEEDSHTQYQLDRLNESITQLKEIQNQGTAGKVNLDAIDKQIRQSISSLIISLNQPSLKDTDQWQLKLLSLMNKKQVTIGKASGFENRINELTKLRNQLAASFSVATASVKSPIAGYFVSKADGFEKSVDYNEALSLTPDRLRQLFEARPDQAESDVIGKVVGDYKWYLACLLPSAEAGELRQGSKPGLLLPFVTSEAIPSEVVAVNRDKRGYSAVIFECNYMSGELSAIRRESVQIRLRKYEGLRIPSSRVITNEDDVQGVYTLVGDMVVFKKIKILYAEPDYVICEEIPGDKSYLQLYDDIIVEGKGLYDGKTVR